MNKRHLPQGITDWIGIAGFVLALTTLALDRVDKLREAPDVFVQSPTVASDRVDAPVQFKLERPPSHVKSAIEWSFGTGEGLVAAFVDGKPAKVFAFVNGEKVDLAKPLVLKAVATNLGKQPVRFVSATATYAKTNGQLTQQTKRIDLSIDETRRRAVVEVSPTDADFFSVPLVVALLDEIGQCHAVFIDGPAATRFRAQIAKRQGQSFCADPDLSRVVTIP